MFSSGDAVDELCYSRRGTKSHFTRRQDLHAKISGIARGWHKHGRLARRSGDDKDPLVVRVQ